MKLKTSTRFNHKLKNGCEADGTAWVGRDHNDHLPPTPPVLVDCWGFFWSRETEALLQVLFLNTKFHFESSIPQNILNITTQAKLMLTAVLLACFCRYRSHHLLAFISFYFLAWKARLLVCFSEPVHFSNVRVSFTWEEENNLKSNHHLKAKM